MESRVNDQSVGLGSRLLLGALAGMAGTAAMTAAMNRLHQRLPPKDRYPLPPREITERMLGSQSEAALKDKATAAHFGYGAVTGALLAVIDPTPRPAFGAVAGVATWIASYFGWIPAFGVLRSAETHPWRLRSEEHTSELQSLMRISYAVFCLHKKTT